jgi:hypothetical protein
MRYLVTARVKPGKESDLLRAVEAKTLGEGSVAGDEYLRNMTDARLCGDGRVKWVERHYVIKVNCLPVDQRTPTGRHDEDHAHRLQLHPLF